MKIKFGIGRRCINPQVPISLAGYFNKRMWDHVLDDIEVRALVLTAGEKTVAMLQFDLVTVSTGLYEDVLASIKEAGIAGVSEENLLVTATHTHTGPEVRAGKPGNNPAYQPFVAKLAAEALGEAMGCFQEGELYYGQTADCRFIFNRRYWMKNGAVLTNPGKLNPEIMRPEGDIDPEISVLAIRSGEKTKVVIANIVNHTDTIGGTGVSADWAGFFCRKVQAALGEGTLAMPLIGCAGNINHFNTGTDMIQTCYAEAERVGSGYCETVLKALPELKAVTGEGLEVILTKAQGAPREIDAAELEEAKAICAKYPDIDVEAQDQTVDITSEDLARGEPIAVKYFANTLIKMADCTTPMVFNLLGVKFGAEVVLASLPCEPFVEIGLELRKSIFRGKCCLVVSHSNGTGNLENCGGYIPNPWNYGRGGYETTPRSNPFAMATPDILVNTWREASKKLL